MAPAMAYLAGTFRGGPLAGAVRLDREATAEGLTTGQPPRIGERAVSYMDKHISCQPYRTCELIHKVYDMIH